MYAYDNWKLSDPNDTPENDRYEAIYERVEYEHPNWTAEEIEEEVQAIIRQEDEDAAEARAEARAYRLGDDMEMDW